MDAERKEELRRIVAALIRQGGHASPALLIEVLDALDDAEARAEELRRENEWMRNAPLNSIWAKRIADAEDERDRLREVLERVEWSGWVNDEVGCSECDAIQKYDKRTKQWRGKHNRGCKVGVVLNRHECQEVGDGR